MKVEMGGVLFSNLKISTRLIGSFCALLLLMVAIGCCGSLGIGKMQWHLNDVAACAKLVENAQRSRADINALRRYEKDVLLNIDDRANLEAYKKEWNKSLELFNARMKEMQSLSESAKDREAVAAVQRNIRLYSAGFDNIFSQILFGNIRSAQAADKRMAQLKDAAFLADSRMADFAATMDNRLQGRIREANQRSETLQSTVLALAITGAVLSILLAAVLVGTIMRPINSLVTMLKGTAGGKEEPTRRGAFGPNGELGEMAAHLNRDFDKREMMTQAASVATASKEMPAAASDRVRNRLIAAERCHETSRVAAGGQSVVQKAVDRLNLLKKEMDKSSKLVERLGKSSARIGDLASTIGDLADQKSPRVPSDKRVARMTRSHPKVLSLFASRPVLQLPNRE